MNRINLDEGYFFGIGLFETMLVQNGVVVFLDEHINRINNSIATLNLNIARLKRDEIQKFIKDNEEKFIDKKVVLKVNLSEKNRVFTTRDYAYKYEDFARGYRCKIASTRKSSSSIISRNKTTNYLENILSLREAKSKGYDEIIFLNEKLEICEGSISNIFFEKDGIIYTPSLESGLLAGIVRQKIIDKYGVVERKISVHELRDFDSCFITNSVLEIIHVNSIDEIEYKRSSMHISVV